MKILIDTNVLIAAYTSYGVCANIVNYCMKKHQLCTSKFILTELEKQLQKKFNLSEKEAKEFLMCFALKNFVHFLKNPKEYFGNL